RDFPGRQQVGPGDFGAAAVFTRPHRGLDYLVSAARPSTRIHGPTTPLRCPLRQNLFVRTTDAIESAIQLGFQAIPELLMQHPGHERFDVVAGVRREGEPLVSLAHHETNHMLSASIQFGGMIQVGRIGLSQSIPFYTAPEAGPQASAWMISATSDEQVTWKKIDVVSTPGRGLQIGFHTRPGFKFVPHLSNGGCKTSISSKPLKQRMSGSH